jgi:hypothetical protein
MFWLMNFPRECGYLQLFYYQMLDYFTFLK